MFKQALFIGVDPLQYWDLTLHEIISLLEAYVEKQKHEKYNSYNNAVMIADFVGRKFVGEALPSIYEIYPELQEVKEATDEQFTAFYRDQFMMFANKHNAQRRENN